ncbi:MAG: hypothetical protein K1060chlam5_00610 [Candidatus Anoxychlamydiales bacterium]|nr:hypothetical protein [Candidatus Anoxychlamydiales bacterium]
MNVKVYFIEWCELMAYKKYVHKDEKIKLIIEEDNKDVG